jgi:hypothetical protein
MIYLAPGRRRAALLVLLSACAIGAAVYGFVAAVTGASWLGPHSLFTPHPTLELVRNLKFIFADGYADANSYLFVLFVIAALTTYGSWARARYFGNTAPLLTSFAVVLLFALVPGIHIWTATLGLPFVFIFVGGIAADLLETGCRALVTVILTAGFVLRGVLDLLALSRWIHNP